MKVFLVVDAGVENKEAGLGTSGAFSGIVGGRCAGTADGGRG